MMKPVLILSLLLAVPAVSEHPKPSRTEEIGRLNERVKNLEDLLQESQERLTIHKTEIDRLQNRVNTAESRIVALERAMANQVVNN